ncbi:fasciclin domain-containing protein [Gimesia panareensis]|uniref:fasciclin domain-containing protein n=1 Tax=Gimesia panareensis TaxID=2527978 RepID=UPI00118BC7A0|nr:fasciclin domain-containing protein [Gimesia panareensis]QDU49215.1 Immunogenic protein MPT70 precursor [Gimesia panareensis]
MNLFVKQFAALATAVTVSFSASLSYSADQKNIVETAVEAGSFKTLATALQEADLISALEGKGPFTVFAPTDAAFKKLPEGTLKTLLKPENKSKLAAILTYHVVPGKVTAAEVTKLSGAKTLNGQRVDIMTKDGKVMVDGATVVKADIKCSNGIIHVIDQVILPADKNLVETASAAGQFKTLLTAATEAGLAETLSNKGPFTVFAPTDKAFAQLPEGTLESLLKPENKQKLAAILKYHVVAGRVYSEDALAAGEAKTLQGQKVKISATGGVAKVNQAKILKTDIDASNGVIHVIDAVLMPPKDKKLTASEACHKIREAVAQGASLYNCGHYDQTAKLYRKTMQNVLTGVEDMPAEVSTQMRQALSHSKNMHCASQQAWTLRNALDHAYARMSAL